MYVYVYVCIYIRLRQSMRISLPEEQCHISARSDLKRQSLQLFEELSHNNNNNNNNSKQMSSDMDQFLI